MKSFKFSFNSIRGNFFPHGTNRLILQIAIAAVLIGIGITVGLSYYFMPKDIKVGNVPTPVFIAASQARPILDTHTDAPREMKTLSQKELDTSWPGWIARRDAEMRTRVEQGVVDSLANLLIFGTSFTREPRVTDEYHATLVRQFGIFGDAADRALKKTVLTRAHDLAIALADPGDDERRLMMRDVVTRAGYGTSSQEDRERLAQYLFDNLVRYMKESRIYLAEVARASQTTAPHTIFDLANIYQGRGLSTDTSLLVDYALEQALLGLKENGFLKPRSILRLGVVGPGLDLIDKNGGYDLYPPQTTQPFVVTDTLLRLKLASKHDLQVSTLDISARVNQHIEGAVRKARDGHAYTMHLVRDKAWNWSTEVVRFWGACGDAIGTSVDLAPIPDIDGLVVRAVRVRPEWVARMHVTDLNIVFQQLPLAPAECFDLLIATNILCYHGPFEQSLALRNAARMLRPGGILLSNTPLPEIEGIDMHLVGSTVVHYSKVKVGSDCIYWFRRTR